MIAPIAFENNTFPEQDLKVFSSFEWEQWSKAASQFNTTNFEYDTTTTRIGGNYGSGFAKWNGAALAPNGKIYGAPHVRTDVLIIDTFTDSVTTTGTVNSSNEGAFYDKITKHVFGFGANGFKIDPLTNTTTNLNGPANRQGGPLQGFDGDKVYTIGTAFTTGVYEYSIQANSATLKQSIGTDRGSLGTLGPNGKCYWAPGNQPNYYVYDPVAGTGTTFGSALADKQFTQTLYFDGYIYSFPYENNTIIRINPYKNITETIYTYGTNPRWTGGGTIGMDGRIYGVAGNNDVNGQYVRWYDPRTNTAGDILIGNSDKSYQTISMGAMGDLYLIPWVGGYVQKLALVRGSGYAQKVIQEYNRDGRFKPTLG
jgi:hypothetical protein